MAFRYLENPGYVPIPTLQKATKGCLVTGSSAVEHQGRPVGERLLKALKKTVEMDVSSTFLFAAKDERVGGDWYDVMFTHGHMAFAIGDVMGHGQAAAGAANLLRGSVARLLMRNIDPAAVMSRINTLTLQNQTEHMTAICGYVDMHSREIVYACAGHPPPILMNGADAKFEDYGGLMLGVEEDASYSTFRISAPERGLFVLYTDGVTENRRTLVDGDQLLLDAVQDATTENTDDKARIIQDTIFKGKAPMDDASILVFTFREPALSEIRQA